MMSMSGVSISNFVFVIIMFPGFEVSPVSAMTPVTK